MALRGGQTIGEAVVAVRPDTSGFNGALHSGLAKVAGLVGGVFAAKKALDFGRGLYEAGEEAARLGRQTEAVLKSTGGAARVSAKDVDTIATALMRYTGVSDETIRNGENLLLTFTNVRNEAGKGNDIFTQATSIMTDMSVALGQDTKSSAIQLGKALNDPIKGMTALQRVGVSFTQQQKDQVEAMVKSGDVLGAQKLILKELNTEFGGSARAQSSAVTRLGAMWDNYKEELGARLLPLVERVADWLGKRLPGAIDTLNRWVSTASAWWAAHWDLIRETTLHVFDAVSAGVTAFATTLAAVIGWVVRFTRDHWDEIVATIRRIIDIGEQVVAWWQINVAPRLAAVFDWIRLQVSNLVAWWRANWEQIHEAVGHVLAVLKVVVEAALIPIALLWYAFHDKIKAVVEAVWDQIKTTVETAIRIVRDVIAVVVALINGDWGKAWAAVKDLLAAAWTWIVSTIQNAGKLAVIAAEGVGRLLKAGLQAAWDGIKAGAKDAWDSIVRGVEAIPGKIGAMVGAVAGAAVRIGAAIVDGVGQGLAKTAGFLGDLGSAVVAVFKKAWNSFVDTLNRATPNSLGVGPFHLNLPDSPWSFLKMHSGGVYQSGRPAGEGPAWLRDGEVVLTPEQAIAMGNAFSRRSPSVAAPGGPSVHIEHATFASGLDLDALASTARYALAAARGI